MKLSGTNRYGVIAVSSVSFGSGLKSENQILTRPSSKWPMASLETKLDYYRDYYQITLALLSQRNYYRITISLYISHGNWYGIAIGLLSSIYVTYVKIGLLSDYNSFFDLT